jgi:hypothetical protein
MRPNWKQLIILAVYLLALAYLFSSMPLIKSLPCGCTFRTTARIWGEPPRLIDLNPTPHEKGGPQELKWSVDWKKQLPRLLAVTVVFLVFFLCVADRGRRRHETNQD